MTNATITNLEYITDTLFIYSNRTHRLSNTHAAHQFWAPLRQKPESYSVRVVDLVIVFTFEFSTMIVG